LKKIVESAFDCTSLHSSTKNALRWFDQFRPASFVPYNDLKSFPYREDSGESSENNPLGNRIKTFSKVRAFKYACETSKP